MSEKSNHLPSQWLGGYRILQVLPQNTSVICLLSEVALTCCFMVGCWKIFNQLQQQHKPFVLLYWPNASFLLPSLRVSYYTQCPGQGRSQDTDWPYGGRRGNWPENELRCKSINWKGLGHQLVQRGYMVWSTCDYKLKAESGFKPLSPDSLVCALMPQSHVEAELQKSRCQHRGQTRTLLQEKAHRTLLHGSVLFPQPNTWEN